MSPYDISDVKNLRKKLDITQSELAKRSGVSQSLIAKIESEKLDPTYSNALKIFEALDSMQTKESLKAKDFIHKGVISCKEDDIIRNVIKKMNDKEISQLPVMRGNMVVGAVSESRILEKLINGVSKDLNVKDVMGEVPPIVSMNAEEAVVSNLLKFFSMVVVQEKGVIKGIITKADVLRKIYS